MLLLNEKFGITFEVAAKTRSRPGSDIPWQCLSDEGKLSLEYRDIGSGY